MTNYIKTTDFAAKDSLPSGNAAKIVKGTEIDAEFNNIAIASATKADKNNSTLTGTTVFETLSDGTIAITGWVDEDNMASNSAVLIPTQQSVKAYVDSNVTAQDLDVTDGTTSIDIDLDSESLGILGGTGITSTALGTGVTLAIDSTVTTLTGTQTLSNKTLTTPVISGALTTNSTIDGRDVAVDGTKLDGIEALADVTDTANVTAAGALMDSELTNITAVKALNQGVATTDSPTFATVGINIAPTSYKLTVNSGATTETTAAAIGYNGDAGTNLYINTDHGNNLVSLYASGSASKEMRFMSGTLEVMRLGTTGNVGVGTSAPASLLDVSSTGEVISTVRSTSTSGARQATLRLNVASTGGDDPAGRVQFTYGTGYAVAGSIEMSHTNPAMKFLTGTTEAMRISGSNVGIGTSSTYNMRTTIAGTGSALSTGTGSYAVASIYDTATAAVGTGGGLAFQGDDGTNSAVTFATVNGSKENATAGNYASYLGFSTRANGGNLTEKVRISSAGNVGINNPNPAQTLSICNPANPNRNGMEIAIGAGDTSSNTIQNYNRATAAYTPLNIAGSILTFGVGTAATERMRITSAGKLVVNGTVAGYSGTGITIGSPAASSSGLSILSTTTGYGYLLFGDATGDGTAGYSGQINYSHSTNRMGVNTNGGERMAIDSSGNVMVGTASQYFARFSVQGETFQNAVTVRVGTNGYPAINFQNTSAQQQGYITTNASSVQYISISDQRAKENIADADDAGSKIDSIQVRKFDWIADGSHQDYGMIAQELQAVAPEAVSGDADSENMMGVDYSKLVPMLVKEIQSLRTRVQELENN